MLDDAERKGKNAWDDPLHPGQWKGDHFGWLVLLGSGVARYAVLKWWIHSKKDEKDRGMLAVDSERAHQADSKAGSTRSGHPNPSA
ncbi:hypothetical protein WJX72_009514 [[Myrmecia] bisecta]|uniref:Uncharacterized protein n=1 Tax=[Myrmecia] bisecta TaxID=41462 RepID=A0AAW1PUY6_9CHLO